MNETIRLAKNEDKEKILDLLDSVFSEKQRTTSKRELEYWNWKFLDNPYGRALLTVAEADNKVIAVNNLWPWEFNFRGSVLRALQPCDSAVHPDFRGKGLFKKMRLHGIQMALQDNYDLFFNFPNEMSLNAYLSLGWHYLGKIRWWIKILKPFAVISSEYSEVKSHPEKLNGIDDIDIGRFNAIIDKSVSYDGYIQTNYLKEFAEWRYLSHPNREYGMVHVENKGKGLLAIYTINLKGKSREMVVVDIIGSKEYLLPLMNKVISTAKRKKIGMIALMNNSRFQTSELFRLGFVPKKTKNMVTLPLKPELEMICRDYRNWSLMAGMHDSI